MAQNNGSEMNNLSTGSSCARKYNVIYAIREGRVERATELINTLELSYFQAGFEGYDLLREALKNKQSAVAKLLLTRGCKVNNKDEPPSNTPLHFAVEIGDIEIIKMILDKGANVNAKNQDGSTPLHAAIEGTKLEVTELLLKCRADVNVKDNNRRTPLHVAAVKGCLQTIQLLLNYGANVNCFCPSALLCEKYAPLHLAAEKGYKEVVMFLLSRGANVDIEGEDSITPLHVAARKGNVDIAQVLLKHGARLDCLTLEKGYTPLHFASEHGNEGTVKLFLNKGAVVNALTKDNITPLVIATKAGHEPIVKLLLENGAEVDTQDGHGKTILHLAVEKGSLVIVKEILKYSPDINNQSNRNSLKTAVRGYGGEYKMIVEVLIEYGFTVNSEDANDSNLLHGAVRNGCLKIVEDLLKSGADVNASDYFFRFDTPLHCAVKARQEDIAELLISNGADINAKDSEGNTPIYYASDNFKITKLLLTNKANVKGNPELLNYAARNGWIEIVELFLQLDADINFRDSSGRTALHMACDAGHVDVVITLLEYGADIDAKNEQGITSLHLASIAGHVEVVTTLLKYGADPNIFSRFFSNTPLGIVIEGIMLIYDLLNNDNNVTKKHLYLCEKEFLSTAEALIRQMVKMKHANLYVSEANLLLLNHVEIREISDFRDKCEKEIARLKNEKFNNSNISFYDILEKDTSSLAKYIRNENILQVLKSDDYKTKFPIYSFLIESNFRQAMERKTLHEQGHKIFHFLFSKFPKLPDYCTEMIISYLSDKDIRILMDACNPLSVNNHNINDAVMASK